MKKLYIAALIICANSLRAGDPLPLKQIDWGEDTNSLSQWTGDVIPLPETGWREDFNSFKGTHASLPLSMTVSKDGQIPMAADDPDFRGIDDGNLSTGGCYAWETGTNEFALGYQPSTDEFTPGFFEASFSNSSAIAYRFITIEYDMVSLNNENRSSQLQLQIRLQQQGIIGTVLTSATKQDEDNPAKWERTRIACRIQLPQPLAPHEMFKLIWYGDDNGGSGARDEYGIDNIHVCGARTIGTVITIR